MKILASRFPLFFRLAGVVLWPSLRWSALGGGWILKVIATLKALDEPEEG